MEVSTFISIIGLGFAICLLMAPRPGPGFGEKFIAYVVALLLALIATTDIFLIKPVAFYFTLGGLLAVVFLFIRSSVRITVRK